MAGFGAKVKLTVDRSSKAEFNKQINSMVGQIKISNKFTVLQKDMDRVRKEAQAMLNSNPMTLKVNKIDCSAAVTNVKKQLQTMLSSLSVQNGVNITGLKDFLGAEGVDATMRSTADAANAAVQKMNEAKTAAASWAGQMEVLDSIAKSVAKTYKSGLSGSNMVADEAQIQRITAAYNEWARKVNEVKVSRSGDIEALQQEGLAIQRNITAIQDKQAAEAKAAAEAERAARAAENAAEREAAANQAELASLKQVASLQERMTKFLQSNSKLSYSDAGNSIRLMLTELRSGAEITTERLREMEGEFANIRTQATATGSLGRSMLDALSKAYERFGGWMLITRSLTTAIHTIKEMIANVRELDGALAQLQIVTGATDTQLTYFLQNATVLAKNLGKSITDVLGSIETFSRLGYNLEDATILAEYANVLANVAAVDTDAATTGMTSIIKGFNMDVEEAEHVADVLVEVGQKYAVSAGEMMEAYEKSGAALNAANTSFEKSAGLIAAANAAVQNSSTVGTALKTISARIRGSKSELEELGEDTSDLAQGFSKYASEIKALTGFDIMVDGTTDTFKDIYDIFEGIAVVWDELSDTQQARIAEILGGVRQLQVVSSILTNWSDAAGAYADAMDSAGVATEANSIYMDTITAKIGQFNAAFEELSNTFFSSDFIKNVVDFGTGFIETLDKIIERFGTLPTLITTIVGAYTAVKGAKGVSIGLLDFNDNKIQLANRGIGSLIKNFNAARESGARLTDSLRIGFNGALNNINQRIGAYNLQLGTSAEAQTLFMRNLEGTDSSLAAYLKSLNGGTASLKGYMTYCRNAGIQTNALGTKSKLAAVGVTVLNTALNMLITMGIALAIQAIISALGSLINAAEIASEKANQLASETREKAEANREELQTLNDLIEKYQELRKEEYVDSGTRAEVRNIQDEITKLVGDQANNLDLVNGKLDDEIDKLKQIALAEAGDTVDSYVAAYAAATNASDKAVGSSKGSFVHPAFGSWDYVGSGDNKAEEILRNAGYGLQVTDGGWFSNTTYVSTYGDAMQRAEQLLGMMEALKAAADYDYSSSELFTTLRQQYERYLEYGDELTEQAKGLRDSVIYEQFLRMDTSAIKTAEGLSQFREELIDTVESSRDLKDAMSNGDINIDNITNGVDDLLAVHFPELFNQLRQYELYEQQLNDLANKLVDKSDEPGYSSWNPDDHFAAIKSLYEKRNEIKDQLRNLSEEDFVIAVKAITEDGATSWDEVLNAIAAYNDEQVVAARRTEELRQQISTLWKSESFTEAKSELVSLLSSLGEISPDKIEELADSSFELASILEQDGMNAQFLSVILTNLANGGDGISLITTEALALNKVLDGMVGEFDKVTDAKARYDAAMSVEEKDTDFKSYAAAFEELNKQFEAGTTNSNRFWAAAEFLFGSEQLAAWGWSDGLDEIYESMKRSESIFSDADSAGAGFIERLYEMSEAGKMVNEQGEKLLEISKDSHGAYIFDIDQENIAAIAEKMGLTEEAVLSCLEALSMWGDIDFFNIDEVLKKIEDLGIVMDSCADDAEELGGKVINLDRLTEQLLTLGKTEKEIYDITTALSGLDNVSFISVTQDANNLVEVLDQLGVVTKDGINISIDYEGFGDILQTLGFTKDEAESLITKLGEVDNISLTNADGEIKDVSDALDYIRGLEFTDVTASVDGIGNAIDEVDDQSTENVVSEIENIGNAADSAVTKIYSIGDAVSDIDGKTATVYYDVRKKNNVLGSLGSILGFANGTDGAPAGPALVGEEDPELIKSGKEAYLAGVNGPEIVDLNEGDQVYNADETKKILRGSGKHILGSVPAFEGGAHGGLVINKDKEGTYGKPYSPSAEVEVKATVDDKELEDALEDALKKLKEELSEIIGNFEHSIFLLEKNGGSADQIVAIYRKMQETVHEYAEKYRAMGLDENSDYIQELQKQWWNYQDSIQKTIVDNFEKMAGERENAIKLTENWMEDAMDKGFHPGVAGYANDIVDYYKRMQEIIHEQAEYYRSQGYADTSDEVSKLSDLWWDYAQKIKDVRDDVVDNLLDMVDAASDLVDKVQSVYDTLHDAADEYASNGGFISVDTLQSIYDLGPQYMQYLQDENGLLVINEERINAVIAAKTEQLALENALAYVERLRLAALGESNESLNELCFATTEATGTTWGLVYAQLEQMKLAGELTNSQYNAAMHNIKAIQSLSKNAIAGIGRVSNEAKESLESLKEELTTMQDGVDGIIKYVMDMLKQRIQDQIDALEHMKDAYAKIIDLRKEALEAAKDEADYEDEVADKIKEIAKLQERINALSLDDSRDAQAQKIKLEEDMAALQKELSDTQADYAREAQENALDDMQEAYEQQKDEEIAALEKTISSYQKLYDMAIDYINQHWQTLYQELIDWNYEYGSVLNQEITDAWAQCEAAAQRYGTSVQSMLAGLKAEISSITSQLSSISSGSYSFSSGDDGTSGGNRVVGPSDSDTSVSNTDMVKAIVARMKKLGAQWSTFNTKDKNDALHKQAAIEAAKLDQYGVHADFRGSDGTWWITRDELNPSNIGKLLHNCYHTGGFVDDQFPLNRKEVPAILEKGELVLDAKKEKGLYRLIDFTTMLSEKLGRALDSVDLSGIFDITKNGVDSTYAPLPAVTNNQSEAIHFGDVYIYGDNEETVKQHQEINRQFTNEVLSHLRIKR